LFLDYKLQWWRFSVFEWLDDSILFDSTYNSSPLSMKKIFNTVHNIRKDLFPDREIWLMLGDMRELWDLTESDHRKVAAYVNAIADRVFLVWESMEKYLKDELDKTGFDMKLVESFVDSAQLWGHVRKELLKSKKKQLIIWKGSQNTIFLEEAVKLLLKNNEDVFNLTRQSDWWMNKKMKFFLN
jgi:UDP-N-acetylmuramyl pentapeptide synthase